MTFYCVYVYTPHFLHSAKKKKKKKKEILSFAAKWLELEDIMLSEVRHKKTNTVMFPLICES